MSVRQAFRVNCRAYKYRRVIDDISKLIKVEQYAKENFLSVTGVKSRLRSGKLLGYKLGNAWWIVKPTD